MVNISFLQDMHRSVTRGGIKCSSFSCFVNSSGELGGSVPSEAYNKVTLSFSAYMYSAQPFPSFCINIDYAVFLV